MSRRFTLAGLLLWVTFVALVLAIVVPLWRWRNRDRLSAVVSDLGVAADGSTIAALMTDGTLHIWHRDDSEPQTTIATQGRMFGCVAVSPHGTYAAISSGWTKSPHEVDVWDLMTHERVQRISAEPASRLAFSPNGKWLGMWWPGAAPVRVFDVSDGLPVQPYFDVDKCCAAAFSPDGDKLCVMTDDGHLQICDVASQTIDAEFDAQIGTTNVQLAYSPDSESIVALSAAKQGKGPARVDVWSLSGKHQSMIVESKSRAGIGFLPASGVLAVPDGFKLKFMDPATLEQVGPHEILGEKPLTNLAAPRRGDFIVLASVGNIWAYDASTYQLESRLLQPPRRPNVSLAVAGLAIWFVVLKLSQARFGERTCPVCGHFWQSAGKGRSEIVCPVCYAKMNERSLDQISAARRRQRVINVFAFLIAFSCGTASVILGVTYKIGSWAIIPLVALTILIAYLMSVAMVMATAWWVRRRSSNVASDVAIAEKASGGRGVTADIGAMMVWSADGTSLIDTLKTEIEVSRDRLATAIGRQVPAPTARTFIFGDDVGLVLYLTQLGLQFDAGARGHNLYLGDSYQRLLLCERQLREENVDLRVPLRWLLMFHLLEILEPRMTAGWIALGLVAALAHDNEHHELGRLNRRVLAGLASGRAIGAVELSLTTFERKWRKHTRRGSRDDFVWGNQFRSQAWSVTEFLCGRGATDERRLAFQRFFNDADRRKRPAAAIVRHFGCSFDEVLAQWQDWMEEQGIDGHYPPPPHLAQYLLQGPIAKVASRDTLAGERVAAIRELGEHGYLLGADALIALLHGDNDEIRAEAVWALECISGKVLGSSAAAWEKWFEGVAKEAVQV